MTYFLFQMIVIGYFLCLKTPQNAPTALCSKKISGGACPRTPLAGVRIHKSRLGTPLKVIPIYLSLIVDLPAMKFDIILRI